MLNPKESGAQTEVEPNNTIGMAMEDLSEAERRVLEKELEEEMAEVNRRKLTCFQKTCTGLIKKTILSITTTATATPMVTPNIASTSILHPGNTSGNIIYVDVSSPDPGGVSMGNPGSFPTANLSYPGGASTSGNLGFSAHTTPTDPNSNFQQPYYQTMPYGPNIPPMVRVFLMVLFPTYFFLGHWITLLLTQG
jgi:hypothetical protein